MQRTLPVIARLMRVDGAGVDHFAGGVHNRYLDTGTQAGVEAHRGARPGRCGQQQGFQVEGEDIDCLDFGFFTQGRHQLGFQMHEHFHAPGPTYRIGQPLIGWAAFVADGETGGDTAFARVMRRIPLRFFFFGIQA